MLVQEPTCSSDRHRCSSRRQHCQICCEVVSCARGFKMNQRTQLDPDEATLAVWQDQTPLLRLSYGKGARVAALLGMHADGPLFARNWWLASEPLYLFGYSASPRRCGVVSHCCKYKENKPQMPMFVEFFNQNISESYIPIIFGELRGSCSFKLSSIDATPTG